MTGENGTQFVYDKGGNIVEKDGIKFEYDNVWTDKLVKVGDTEIEYDEIGNPISIGDVSLTWQGRQLISYGDISYTYNEDGLRTSKTVGGVKTEYFWIGNTLIGQKTGNDVIFFNEHGVNHNGSQYFYIKNLQGDVIGLVDNDGNIVAEYEYDAWGEVISATGSMAEVNPIRYRGYYYDSEIQMYYNQQRYYNPSWGRWLSADSVFSLSDISQNNLYLYCKNNPIAYIDSIGMAAKKTTRHIS